MKLGPYELDQIYTGDARILAQEIPDESVDLIFTDPPWGINFKYDNGYIDDSEFYIQIVDWIVEISNRILVPGGYAFVYQATKRLRETWNRFPQDSRLFSSCKNFIQIKGISVEYAVDFIVFWKKPGKQLTKGLVRDWNLANTSNTSNGSRGIGFDVRTSPPRPLDAVMNIIQGMCPEGGIIIDYFVGSGTTCKAARMLGRHYLAFEIDPDTAERARRRVEQTQPPLLIPEPEQMELEIVA